VTSAQPDISVVRLDVILALREEYRREMNCQIVHDSWHRRGFTQSYLFTVAGQVVGYGAMGGSQGAPRTTAKEFFVRPGYRNGALPIFRRFLSVGGAMTIEAQTNDALLFEMLNQSAVVVSSDTILFADAGVTRLGVPGVTLRPVTWLDRRRMFPHTHEPVGDWGLEVDSRIVATGGILYHYNPPYGDIYMEVAPPFRRRGYGAYLVQELRRICREGGHVPAARTGWDNAASRRTLQRAGMKVCGRIVTGRLAV
jgi:GNAT superfamily N-acetyltransferase